MLIRSEGLGPLSSVATKPSIEGLSVRSSGRYSMARRSAVPSVAAARLVNIADEDPSALAGRQKGGRLADPGGVAGDDDGSLLHVHRCAFLRCRQGTDVPRGRPPVSIVDEVPVSFS
jgi:hypothetical protein